MAARRAAFDGTIGTAASSTAARWAGRILSGIAIAFLSFDVIGKLLVVPQVLEGTTSLGFPARTILPIGVLELVCLVAYVVPRTRVLGAMLLTGYLGGAIATHVRLENPLFTHVLFPIYVATFVWGGLVLRDRRLRAVLLDGRG